jgi:hypothetical protein
MGVCASGPQHRAGNSHKGAEYGDEKVKNQVCAAMPSTRAWRISVLSRTL